MVGTWPDLMVSVVELIVCLNIKREEILRTSVKMFTDFSWATFFVCT